MPHEFVQYLSREAEVSPQKLAKWNAQAEFATKRDACLKSLQLCLAAKAIPRRLGAKATPDQLASDKKFWKQAIFLYHRLSENWEVLSGSGADWEIPIDRKVNSRAMAVDVGEWVETQTAAGMQDRTVVVTRLAQRNEQKLANAAAHLYTLEVDELRRLLAAHARRAAL